MEEQGLAVLLLLILLKALTLVFTVLLFLTHEKSFRSAIYAIAAAGDRPRGWHCSYFSLRHAALAEPVDRQLLGRMLRFGLRCCRPPCWAGR